MLIDVTFSDIISNNNTIVFFQFVLTFAEPKASDILHVLTPVICLEIIMSSQIYIAF